MTATVEIFKFEKNVATFDAGQTIFNAGDEGHCMYVRRMSGAADGQDG